MDSLSYAYRFCIMAFILVASPIILIIGPKVLLAEEEAEANAQNITQNSTGNKLFDNGGGNIDRPEFEGYFKVIDTVGTVVVKNLGTGKVYVYNEERAKKEFTPGSSFILPLSLFSVESYVIKATDDTLISGAKPYALDGISVDEPACRGDVTLQEAYRYRCIGTFQKLAADINSVRMKGFMGSVKYGNGEISDDLANFWLKGPLRTSCFEYMSFIEKLYNEELPFSSHTYSQIKSLIISESTSNYALVLVPGYSFSEMPNIAWVAGWQEDSNTTLFFVMNMDVKNSSQLNKRADIIKHILSDIKANP